MSQWKESTHWKLISIMLSSQAFSIKDQSLKVFLEEVQMWNIHYSKCHNSCWMWCYYGHVFQRSLPIPDTYTDFLQGSIFCKTIWLIEKIFSEDAFLKTSYSLTLYSTLEGEMKRTLLRMTLTRQLQKWTRKSREEEKRG